MNIYFAYQTLSMGKEEGKRTEEVKVSSASSTLEKMLQLRKELKVEEAEFSRGAEARIRRVEELKRINADLEARVKVAREEVLSTS